MSEETGKSTRSRSLTILLTFCLTIAAYADLYDGVEPPSTPPGHEWKSPPLENFIELRYAWEGDILRSKQRIILVPLSPHCESDSTLNKLDHLPPGFPFEVVVPAMDCDGVYLKARLLSPPHRDQTAWVNSAGVVDLEIERLVPEGKSVERKKRFTFADKEQMNSLPNEDFGKAQKGEIWFVRESKADIRNRPDKDSKHIAKLNAESIVEVLNTKDMGFLNQQKRVAVLDKKGNPKIIGWVRASHANRCSMVPDRMMTRELDGDL